MTVVTSDGTVTVEWADELANGRGPYVNSQVALEQEQQVEAVEKAESEQEGCWGNWAIGDNVAWGLYTVDWNETKGAEDATDSSVTGGLLLEEEPPE